jgi:hypothetical protein
LRLGARLSECATYLPSSIFSSRHGSEGTGCQSSGPSYYVRRAPE